MAAKFKKGDAAKLIAVIPTGTVSSFRMDDEGQVWCLLEWTDGEGNDQHRWFLEDQLTTA